MIAKYFWDVSDRALRTIERTIRHPRHPQYLRHMVTLLTRCDQPKELFAIMSEQQFMDTWPRIRTYWIKQMRQSDARDWWDTLYEQLVVREQRVLMKARGAPAALLRALGRQIKTARLQHGWNQQQLAQRIGMRQPDISRVEEGRKNLTLLTTQRLCHVLGIPRIDL